jgi:hypothetical protein
MVFVRIRPPAMKMGMPKMSHEMSGMHHHDM